MNIYLKSLLSSLAFSFLLYSKSLGINLIIISILVIIVTSTLRIERAIPWRFSLVYLATAVFVFMNPTGFTTCVHLMAFLVFVGKYISNTTSLHISWLIGFINMLVASVANYAANWQLEKKDTKKEMSPKIINRVKGAIVAFILILIFGLLYRNANPVFNNLVEQINLDFISPAWLFFTLMGYVLFYHLLSPFNALDLVNFDANLSNQLIRPAEIVLIGKKKNLESEHTLGSIVFAALNLLLVFFLITDFIYLFQEKEISNSVYSESVHQGVYALLFSIICAIGLILYFFRGNLNFYLGNKQLKKLTYMWIMLNTILVAVTCYKNYAYVEALGLTYKRIGVFVYLILTLTGLVTAYIKVSKIKSFAYLIRTNLATVFTFLIVSASIPWNNSITWYNLNQIESVDLKYLIEIGDNNSKQLHQYAIEYSNNVKLEDKISIDSKYLKFKKRQAKKTWQEYALYNLMNMD